MSKARTDATLRRIARLAPIGVGERLLALDVSSNAIGLAVLSPRNRGTPELLLFGALFPEPKSSPPIVRIKSLIAQLADAIGPEPVHRVAIEWAGGTNHRRGQWNGHGLNTLGQAQGAAWQWLRNQGHDPETIPDSDWTAGMQKSKRAGKVRLYYPRYAAWADDRPDNDPGLDAADAIGLGLWRIEHT